MSLPSSRHLLRLPLPPRLLRPSTPCLSVSSIRSHHSNPLRNPSSLVRLNARSSRIAQTALPSPSTLPTLSSPPSRSLATSGKSSADEIVEELQELYENAKDEFEIATDSTDGGTIYAPSDRESARDALNQLLIVFELYTQEHSPTQAAVREQAQAEAEAQGEAATSTTTEGEDGDEGQVVETNFDPAAVEPGVREEVKKRVAQRVRELRNAVELLEERAMTE